MRESLGPDLTGNNEPPDKQVQKAVRDRESRTLAKIPGDIAKLVYLCSTRDYNTGRYYHDGLNVFFGAEVANRALAKCHENTFQVLLYKSLSQIVDSLQRYFEATGQPREQILQVWQKLQAYHVLIPAGCDSLSAEFFLSNIKIALAMLNQRDRGRPPDLEPARVLPPRL
jgi:hypothetical protein